MTSHPGAMPLQTDPLQTDASIRSSSTASKAAAPVACALLARRGFLAASALVLAGCVSGRSQRTEKLAAGMPEAMWPGGQYQNVPAPPRPRAGPAPSKPLPQSIARPEPYIPGTVIPRSRWAKSGPDVRGINRMLPVKSLTIHHEGWEPFTALDFHDTAARLDQVRIAHRNAKGGGYADIGYHFIIDRDGRIWEGRSLQFQGAHVRNHNEGNIGIMCLGNFEQQKPTDKQLAALSLHVRAMMAKYKIRAKPRRQGDSGVYTHQEWSGAKTLCPGRHLQSWVVKARSRAFA